VLKPKQAYSEAEQQCVLRACLERCSLRGIARIFAMARQTIVRWFREHTQKLPDVKETLLPATPNDVLELDELWSFVQQKEQTRWVWTAICRRTRQIVAFVIGDRSKTTCLRLWEAIPEGHFVAVPSAIFGPPIDTFSQLPPIAVLAKKLGKLLIWSAGTIRYVNGLGVMCDKHSLFLSPTSIIVSSLWRLSSSII
jgi:hypothetical protein